MSLTRRAVLAGAAALPALSRLRAPLSRRRCRSVSLPAKAAFARMPMTYLDSGSTHPMSLGAKAALEEYLRFKTQDGSLPGYSVSAMEKAVLESFGRLIGASPDELSFVRSTTMGENLVLQALGLSANWRAHRHGRAAFLRLVLHLRRAGQGRHGCCGPCR